MNFDLMETNFSNEGIIETMLGEGQLICDVIWGGEVPKNPAIAIKKLNEKDMLDNLACIFAMNGLQVFSCVAQLPLFKNKGLLSEETDLLHYEGAEMFAVGLPLAALLGLPAIAPKDELKELGILLNYFLDKAVENPQMDLRMDLQRGFGNPGIYLACKDPLAQVSLQKTFDEMVAASPVLQAWVKSQTEAIKNTAVNADSLYCSTHFHAFVEQEKKNEYLIKASGRVMPFKINN